MPPLPSPERRRRNAPTIPTTNLPAAGRPGPAPKPPRWVKLGRAGRAWWAWAWATPQACAWSDGDGPVVARRAMLEDVLAEARAAGEAGLAVCREMVQIDDRLGLTPKAMAQLRWRIVDAEPAKESKPATSQRLRVVNQ